MGWAPPDDDGGAPILYYMVREEKTGAKQRCDTNECVFRKLKTGGNYSFRVQAINRVGASDWSNVSRSARADTQPGRVQNIRMAGRDDGQITIAWDKPSTNTSRILDYTITLARGRPRRRSRQHHVLARRRAWTTTSSTSSRSRRRTRSATRFPGPPRRCSRSARRRRRRPRR